MDNTAFVPEPNIQIITFHTPLSKPDTALWIMLPIMLTGLCSWSEDSGAGAGVGVGAGGCGATITLTVALRLSVLVTFPENVSMPEKAYVPGVFGSYGGVTLSHVTDTDWVVASGRVAVTDVGRFAEISAVP